MSVRLKILLVGINIVCFAVTLLTPSQITPFAVLPTIIAAMTWLFTSQNEDIKQNRTAHWCVIIYTAIIVICLFAGFIANIEPVDPVKGIYIFLIKQGVLLIGNSAFPYPPFAIVVGVPTSILMMVEVIMDYKNQKKSSKPGIPINKTFELALNNIDETDRRCR